jgi:hypothetical protein
MVEKLRKLFRGRLTFFSTGRLYYRFTPIEHPEASGSFAPARGFDAFNHREVDGFLRGI